MIYRAIGIPVQMFTVLFAIGRLPGWICSLAGNAKFAIETHLASPADLHRTPRTSFVPRDHAVNRCFSLQERPLWLVLAALEKTSEVSKTSEV